MGNPFLILVLATSLVFAQAPPPRLDHSPDAAARATFFLPKAVMQAVKDPVFLSLFGPEKKERLFQTALTGLDGSVFWIAHPKAGKAIPIDATKPERWLSPFRNNLELTGILLGKGPGGQPGKDLWKVLDEFQITNFFIDSAPSASGYVKQVEEALALELKTYRSVESVTLEQGFLRTYFRGSQFTLVLDGMRERYTFICRKDQDKILAVLAQRPTGITDLAEEKGVAEQIGNAYGLGVNGSWSMQHGNMFGEGASEGGIWLPDVSIDGKLNGKGTIRKFWFSPEFRDYRQEVARDIDARWFAVKKKALGVNSEQQVIEALISRTKEKISLNPDEAEGEVKLLYGLAKGPQLETVRALDDSILEARNRKDVEVKAAQEQAGIAAKEKVKWTLRDDLRNSYNFLKMYQQELAYEKKVQAASGVKNLSKLYQLGQNIVGLQEMIARQRKEFRQVFGREFDLVKDTQAAIRDAEARRKGTNNVQQVPRP